MTPTTIILPWRSGRRQKVKKLKHCSAVAEKEVVASRKRKSVAVMGPRKKKSSNTKIIESDSDDDDNDNFLALCDNALKSNPLDI